MWPIPPHRDDYWHVVLGNRLVAQFRERKHSQPGDTIRRHLRGPFFLPITPCYSIRQRLLLQESIDDHDARLGVR